MIRSIRKWIRPILLTRHWLAMMLAGLVLMGTGLAYLLVLIFVSVEPEIGTDAPPFWFEILTLSFAPIWWRVFVPVFLGTIIFLRGMYKFNQVAFDPISPNTSIGDWVNMMNTHYSLSQGIRAVAIGGGTGLPASLRALKTETSNITAIVTVADDGGSSGRLRRELGVQPPGDIRNNIVALARDEALMTNILNYRFDRGDLEGHSLGNLFLAALVETQGGMEQATLAAGNILAIQGRVLPCTNTDVNLIADIEDPETGKLLRIAGESNIGHAEGTIRRVAITPSSAQATPSVTGAILASDLIVMGPGSLFTSVIPNLLVNGVVDAMKESPAVKVYVCNIANQPGETWGFDVEQHVLALEDYLGEGVLDVVVANNNFSRENAIENTIYVEKAPFDSPILDRYNVIYTDLTDDERTWRHSPKKLRKVLMKLVGQNSRENVDEMPKAKRDDNRVQSATIKDDAPHT